MHGDLHPFDLATLDLRADVAEAACRAALVECRRSGFPAPPQPVLRAENQRRWWTNSSTAMSPRCRVAGRSSCRAEQRSAHAVSQSRGARRRSECAEPAAHDVRARRLAQRRAGRHAAPTQYHRALSRYAAGHVAAGVHATRAGAGRRNGADSRAAAMPAESVPVVAKLPANAPPPVATAVPTISAPPTLPTPAKRSDSKTSDNMGLHDLDRVEAKLPPKPQPSPAAQEPVTQADASAADSTYASEPPPPPNSTLALAWKPGIERLPPKSAGRREYEVIEYANLGGVIGQRVRVITDGEKRIEGYLISADSSAVHLRVGRADGDAQFEVPKKRIQQIQLVRRQPSADRRRCDAPPRCRVLFSNDWRTGTDGRVRSDRRRNDPRPRATRRHGCVRRNLPVIRSRLFPPGVAHAGRARRAEDVVQEVFLKMIDTLSRLSRRCAVRRLAQAHVRERVHRSCCAASVTRHDDADALFAPIASPETNAALKVDAWSLLSMCRRARALTLTLHELEGYTHKELAELFGQSESYSKSILARALKRLQALVEPQCQRRSYLFMQSELKTQRSSDSIRRTRDAAAERRSVERIAAAHGRARAAGDAARLGIGSAAALVIARLRSASASCAAGRRRLEGTRAGARTAIERRARATRSCRGPAIPKKNSNASISRCKPAYDRGANKTELVPLWKQRSELLGLLLGRQQQLALTRI